MMTKWNRNQKRLMLWMISSLLISWLAYLWHPVSAVFLMFLLSVGGVFWFITATNRDVDAMTQQLDELNAGTYQFDIQAYHEGSFSKLQSSMNKTTLQLRSMNDALMNHHVLLHRSVEDMSHQLKTPIASLLILNELQSNEDPLVIKSKQQIMRLQNLIEGVLLLMRLEASMIEFHYELHPIQPLIESVLVLLEPKLMLANVEILLDIPHDLVWYCDAHYTKEALYNIIENKLRFAHETIVIKGKPTGITATLRISDDGPTISKDERSKIFERFYSGIHKNENSLGIGCALAQDMMIGQGGSLRCQEGNTFEFQMSRFKS